MTRWTPRVTVAAIAVHAECYLMVRETIDGKQVLNQPAGHLENGEDLVSAVVREVREETGTQFTPASLVGIYRWQMDADTTFVRFLFSGSVDQPHALAPKDPIIDDALWLSEHDIRTRSSQLRSPQVLRGLEDYIQGQRFPLACLKNIVE